ncbi:acyltransferase [Psychrobacter immobilis]|uniref:acyltransferase n=1 Tax=Psychrobacter immobilis TaxID=498 RepID=UPI001918ED7D|nr:acyltransferase [Psychrobacter immobilis]
MNNYLQLKKFEVKGNVDENYVLLGDNSNAKGLCSLEFWRKSKNNKVTIGDNFVMNNLKIVFKGDDNKLLIGNDVRLTGHILIVGNSREVVIGDNSTAQGVYILSRDADVYIGKECMLSREIEIRSTDVHKIYDLSTNQRINNAKNVVIGDNVWIGARALVSKGAVIPTGSIIGACSFVNKKFEVENSIIAGTPAKVVKSNIRWER